MLDSFFKGIAIGLFFAVPVGPIGVLCIRRSLATGFKSGLATGLGAATADAIFGAIAAFGLTSVSSFLIGQTFWLGVAGGFFLVYLGIATFRRRPPERESSAPAAELGGVYCSTLILTITNPMSILLFVAAFAGFRTSGSADYRNASALVLGVFLGSTAWWLVLSGSVSYFRARFDPGRMKLVNQISGAAICAFGIYAIARLLI